MNNPRHQSETRATKARHTRHHLSVWMTRAEVCAALGCSPRTLARKVEAGEVERRQEGRQGFYRMALEEARQCAPESETRATEARHTRQDDGALLDRLMASERARGCAEGLVEELRGRLAEAEAEVERLRKQLRAEEPKLADVVRRLERLERRRLVASAARPPHPT